MSEIREVVDKMRIVHYINVSGITTKQAEIKIQEYKKENSYPDINVIEYFIPILNCDSKIKILR